MAEEHERGVLHVWAHGRRCRSTKTGGVRRLVQAVGVRIELRTRISRSRRLNVAMVLPQPRVQGRRERVEGQGHGSMMVPPYQNAEIILPPGPSDRSGARPRYVRRPRGGLRLLVLREGANFDPKTSHN